MKKFQNLGIALTKAEQKKVNGGSSCIILCADQRAYALFQCFNQHGGGFPGTSCENEANNAYWNCMNGCGELPY
jgi:hypothetical protein